MAGRFNPYFLQSEQFIMHSLPLLAFVSFLTGNQDVASCSTRGPSAAAQLQMLDELSLHWSQPA